MLLRGFGVISLMLSAVVCLLTEAFESYTWLWLLPATALGVLVVEILLAFLFLVVLCAAVDFNKEQTHDSKLYRRVLELYVESALPALRVQVKVTGMNKVPAQGRFMLVCNHCSLIDPVILVEQFAGRQVAFISKQENRDMFLVGKMMHKIQCQLLNRENDREALKTILRCIQLIKDDRASIGVFPEGRIYDDLKFHPLRPGVFKIAQKAQVPIVVCTMTGTGHAISNLLRLKKSEIMLSVVEVIPPEQHLKENTVQLSDRIYRMMADSLGPENVAQVDDEAMEN